MNRKKFIVTAILEVMAHDEDCVELALYELLPKQGDERWSVEIISSTIDDIEERS